MNCPSRCSVIVIGAGVSGLSAGKVLAENGVNDLLILEATDHIGGRVKKEKFGGVSVELGAGWIAGVGGKEMNPVWELANVCGMRTKFSDYSNARYNIYDRSGKIFPRDVAADYYEKAVEAAKKKLQNEDEMLSDATYQLIDHPYEPKTPLELAIDFILHDFEMAEVEPISTYLDYGDREFLVADERGFEHLLYKMAETFLFTSEGKVSDPRLKLNKVVRELHHSRSGVAVKTEDGCVYEANYVILSVSIGVLQSNLISFSPSLPKWKTEAIEGCDVMIYTKIFLRFPCMFWPSDPDKEFFIYSHERRGYYTFWQSMDNAYPRSNILVVTVTNDESKRVESQPDQQTLQEAMAVLRDMFGPDVPDAVDILVPRWWDNRFQRCSYSNHPIISDNQAINHIKAAVGRVFFTGEHTSERFNGYVHGAYLAGIDTSKSVLEDMRREKESEAFLLEPLLPLTGPLTLTAPEPVASLHKYDIYLASSRGITPVTL